jgi:hypothetical protein
VEFLALGDFVSLFVFVREGEGESDFVFPTDDVGVTLLDPDEEEEEVFEGVFVSEEVLVGVFAAGEVVALDGVDVVLVGVLGAVEVFDGALEVLVGVFAAFEGTDIFLSLAGKFVRNFVVFSEFLMNLDEFPRMLSNNQSSFSEP